MSGVSSTARCPMCGSKDMEVYSDWKPHEFVSGECYECGFCYQTNDGQMTLKEVNEHRKDLELPKLKKLKPQEY